MATRKKNGTAALAPRVDRLEEAFLRLETVQRDTSERLGRIEETLRTSSRVFELMHDRLENLEQSQQALVEGQQAIEHALVEGQRLIVERLDRLVEASTRDRTQQVERITRIEARLDALERREPR